MNIHLSRQAVGLDGIPAAVTALSLVDGEAGKLVIAGRKVEDLAGRLTFEQAAAELWRLADPTSDSGADTQAAFGAARVWAFSQARRICASLTLLAPIDGLRAAIAALNIADGPGAAVAITAAVPVLVTVLEALRHNHEPLAPDPGLGHAADILRMMRGRMASAAEQRALDIYLATVSDHGMNASTFTCRVVTSTHANLVSAITAAYGALSGPLHGGAPGPVLDMLDEIGSENRMGSRIANALTRGDRLMGFGHRIYQVRDPRADVLKNALIDLAPDTPRLALALAVEREAKAQLKERHPERRLDTNVEFYTALLLDALGIDRSLFTPIFAMGRCAGWTAHAIEHLARRGRLIRPDAIYDGVVP